MLSRRKALIGMGFGAAALMLAGIGAFYYLAYLEYRRIYDKHYALLKQEFDELVEIIDSGKDPELQWYEGLEVHFLDFRNTSEYFSGIEDAANYIVKKNTIQKNISIIYDRNDLAKEAVLAGCPIECRILEINDIGPVKDSQQYIIGAARIVIIDGAAFYPHHKNRGDRLHPRETKEGYYFSNITIYKENKITYTVDEKISSVKGGLYLKGIPIFPWFPFRIPVDLSIYQPPTIVYCNRSVGVCDKD